MSHGRLTYLAPSNTTSALTTVALPPPSSSGNADHDQDVQCRRVFDELETLCVTPEARESLWAWQQSYARRLRRPKLLPDGGSMHDGPPGGTLLGHLRGYCRTRSEQQPPRTALQRSPRKTVTAPGAAGCRMP